MLEKKNFVYNSKSVSQIKLNTFGTRTGKFTNFEGNNLSNLSKQSEKNKKFQNELMTDVRSNERSLFSIHDPQGVMLLYWLGLNFSHLNEHRFRHNI